MKTVAGHINSICTKGDNLVQLAGLIEMCSASLYKEAFAIAELTAKSHLTAHIEAMTGHISFIADTVRGIGEEIEEAANAASDLMEKRPYGSAGAGRRGLNQHVDIWSGDCK